MTEIKDNFERDSAGIPTVYVELVGEDDEQNYAPYCTQYAFYCPYCEKKHYHGLPEGLRVAHCFPENDDSPLNETGYYIKIKPIANH